MAWKLAKKKLIPRESLADMSLEGADPELCITLFQRGLNFSGLKQRLLAADQPWMEEFLASGGLTSIFDSLEALGKKGFVSITDALRQLECVACVKAVMNNRFGLEFIIHTPGERFVHKLAQGQHKPDLSRKKLINSGMCHYTCTCITLLYTIFCSSGHEQWSGEDTGV